MPHWIGSTRAGRLPAGWETVIRPRILARDPICRICGRRPSTEVDHDRPGDDHSDANLQGVCTPCHLHKSGREGGLASAAARKAKRQRPQEKHPGLL